MSNKRYAGALRQLRTESAPSGAVRNHLSAVPDDLEHTVHDGAFEAPFKFGMVYLLARIFYEVRDQTEEVLAPFNLTPMQFTILASLGRWKGMCSAELSRRFKVTPQTMGEMIANLERRGLVARQEDPANRRALRLTLSDAGVQMVEACNAEMQKMEMEMFSSFSPLERHELRTRLIALHEHFGLGSR